MERVAEANGREKGGEGGGGEVEGGGEEGGRGGGDGGDGTRGLDEKGGSDQRQVPSTALRNSAVVAAAPLRVDSTVVVRMIVIHLNVDWHVSCMNFVCIEKSARPEGCMLQEDYPNISLFISQQTDRIDNERKESRDNGNTGSRSNNVPSSSGYSGDVTVTETKNR
ncbi:hypothetical protein V1477_020261 [Vespula maculifrons]|uniref:Uncharacterized protein n=3 Tax=Vespula TaxID=7451 RepID=A0A834KDX4_VESGE|nr:hypothetical protein HZH66_005069 [Vespula vulgaris]KAF7406179.1 hypothetical protein HZH68_005548 [Vespula germanica]